MKTLFESAAVMDVVMLHRTADLLAWFLSNNNYQWPWVRWERVLQVRAGAAAPPERTGMRTLAAHMCVAAPPERARMHAHPAHVCVTMQAPPIDAQRRFCSLTLAKMIRLCANLAYVQQHVIPSDDRWLSLIPASDQPTAPPPNSAVPGTLQEPYEDFMNGLVAKLSDAAMEELVLDQAASVAGGAAAVLHAFMHALLFRAKMSPYHTETLLSRYRSTLEKLIAEVWQHACVGERPAELHAYACMRCTGTSMPTTLCSCKA
jgi:MIF4G like